nr:hypothetical protein DGKKSRWO_DGKKSRWO_CDS_0056 [uncultured phage]CAI9752212.1 hypothetical protein CVNMHQAP_CVNMHQAP_CDS_0056 [uncultured phage]
MRKIFEDISEQFADEDGCVQESVCVYSASPEYIEEFELLSHAEKLAKFKLTEEKTPNTEHGTVIRYYFDASTAYIIIHKTVTSW